MNVLREFSVLALADTAQTTVNWATLITAILALVGTIITAIVSIRNSSQQSKSSAKLQRAQSANQIYLKRIEHNLLNRQREIDFRRRQLDEFYGQILMLRQVSRGLRDRLPETDQQGQRWRLVHNIAQVKSGPDKQLRRIVERIIEIDTEIASIMKNKTSLLETFPPPASFSTFARHATMLEIDWRLGKDQDPTISVPFPDNLDLDLSTGYSAIKRRLDALLAQDLNPESSTTTPQATNAA